MGILESNLLLKSRPWQGFPKVRHENVWQSSEPLVRMSGISIRKPAVIVSLTPRLSESHAYYLVRCASLACGRLLRLSHRIHRRLSVDAALPATHRGLPLMHSALDVGDRQALHGAGFRAGDAGRLAKEPTVQSRRHVPRSVTGSDTHAGHPTGCLPGQQTLPHMMLLGPCIPLRTP